MKNGAISSCITKLILLIICVGKEVEHLFVAYTPTYIDHKVSTNRSTGMPIEMNKLFMSEIKLDPAEYDYFLSAKDQDVEKLLAR